MTIIWLTVWLIKGVPTVASWGPWNAWGVALFVCLGVDLIGALGRSGRQLIRAERPRIDRSGTA